MKCALTTFTLIFYLLFSERSQSYIIILSQQIIYCSTVQHFYCSMSCERRGWVISATHRQRRQSCTWRQFRTIDQSNLLIIHISGDLRLLLILPYLFFLSPWLPLYLSIISPSLYPPSCFAELQQPFLGWKAWTMQILKAVSFAATVTHRADCQAAEK